MLVEKPIASSVHEGRNIIAAARRSGVTLKVGQEERDNPGDSASKVALRGEDILSIAITRVGPFPPRMSNVGIVIDLAVHDIDLIRWFTDSDIVEVQPQLSNAVAEREDIALLQFRTASGVLAHINTNWLTPFKARNVTVATRGKYLMGDLLTRQVTECFGFQPDGAYSMRHVSVGHDEPLRAELIAFAEAVRTGRTPAVTGEEGVESLEIATRCLAGRTVVEPRLPANAPSHRRLNRWRLFPSLNANVRLPQPRESISARLSDGSWHDRSHPHSWRNYARLARDRLSAGHHAGGRAWGGAGGRCFFRGAAIAKPLPRDLRRGRIQRRVRPGLCAGPCRQRRGAGAVVHRPDFHAAAGGPIGAARSRGCLHAAGDRSAGARLRQGPGPFRACGRIHPDHVSLSAAGQPGHALWRHPQRARSLCGGGRCADPAQSFDDDDTGAGRLLSDRRARRGVGRVSGWHPGVPPGRRRHVATRRACRACAGRVSTPR